MSKTWKILLIIIFSLIVLLVVAKRAGWINPSGKAFQVETAEVHRARIVQTVIASGKIQPEVEVKISPEVSGEIIELPIVEGQSVEKGDLLVRINPDIYVSGVNRAQASVNSAKAGLSQSKAQLIEAENNFNRNQKLFEEKVISQADFDAINRAYQVAKLQVEASEYQLQSAQATYREAQDNLKRTTIYAPTSGTISSLSVELGERVVGTAQMAGTELLRIANLQEMEVVVEVNENDIVQVEVGDTAVIEVDAFLEDEFKGVVTEIANSANTIGTSADQVTNFEVKIRILKSSYQHLMPEGDLKSPFRPGMTATVEIQTRTVSNALSVPIQAVTTRQDTSREAKSYKMRGTSSSVESDETFEVVFVLKEGKAELQVVKTGIQDEQVIQITKGLEEGQTIISGPYSIVSRDLKNGSEVEVKSGAEKEEDDR
ncbi:MAG: efflux RND transporter periplasmic adaptor subunit [Bacteroidota bacterium]|nr:efflux RND transporter periplasmic adaptor subunit [Bacteroidota bacterium]